jgi:hypothetical protein
MYRVIQEISKNTSNSITPRSSNFNNLENYNGIIVYKDNISNLSALKKEELIFIYFIKKALKPFNKIYRNQEHLYLNDIIKLFKDLYYLTSYYNLELSKSIKNYYVYLITNNSFYAHRNHKKMFPSTIDKKLRKKKLIDIINKYIKNVDRRNQSIKLINFLYSKEDYYGVVDNSINKSGNNYYSKTITDSDYKKIESKYKTKNTYFEKFNNIIHIRFYSANDKYKDELTESVYWLKMAYNLVNNNLCYFDQNMLDSLYYLIKYLITGDEEHFKTHSKFWIRINTRVQYTIGFIESYRDPKKIIGAAGGNIILRSQDTDNLKDILPFIQNKLPFPSKYKSSNINKTLLLNPIICNVLAAVGYYGPARKTAAYCLPNYKDIISKYGSKQVIYEEQDNQLINLKDIKLYNKFNENKRNRKIIRCIKKLHTIFHETIGHASSHLSTHTIIEEDLEKIKDTIYKNKIVGDVITLTEDNYNIFMTTDKDSIEEMRADIIGLYILLTETELLFKNNLYENLYSVYDKTKIITDSLIIVLEKGFQKLSYQIKNFKKLINPYARANIVIINYLIESNCILIKESTILNNDEEHIIYDISIINLSKTIEKIIELMIRIQKITSVADNKDCVYLFNRYTSYPLSITKMNEISKNLKRNNRKLYKKTTSLNRLFPKFTPIYDTFDNVIDVKVSYYKDIIEQEEA